MELTNDEQATWDRLAIPDTTNKFQKHRLVNDNIWWTQDNTFLRIEEMKTSHIRNCIKLLENSKQTNTKAYRGMTAEFTRRIK